MEPLKQEDIKRAATAAGKSAKDFMAELRKVVFSKKGFSGNRLGELYTELKYVKDDFNLDDYRDAIYAHVLKLGQFRDPAGHFYLQGGTATGRKRVEKARENLIKKFSNPANAEEVLFRTEQRIERYLHSTFKIFGIDAERSDDSSPRYAPFKWEQELPSLDHRDEVILSRFSEKYAKEKDEGMRILLVRAINYMIKTLENPSKPFPPEIMGVFNLWTRKIVPVLVDVQHPLFPEDREKINASYGTVITTIHERLYQLNGLHREIFGTVLKDILNGREFPHVHKNGNGHGNGNGNGNGGHSH